MFDYVNYNADCYACGVALEDFQSKDGPCDLRTLDPARVRSFYTVCDKCGEWNEFIVEVSGYEVIRFPRVKK